MTYQRPRSGENPTASRPPKAPVTRDGAGRGRFLPYEATMKHGTMILTADTLRVVAPLKSVQEAVNPDIWLLCLVANDRLKHLATHTQMDSGTLRTA